ncbi:hypothetical protein D3C72_1878490 [compost metagenome]
MALAEGFVAQRQQDRQPRRLHARVHRVHILHFEVEQQPGRLLAARRSGNRLMRAVENGEVGARVGVGLQVHVPVALEQRPEIHVLRVERHRLRHVGGHDHRVVTRCFHRMSPLWRAGPGANRITYSLYLS